MFDLSTTEALIKAHGLLLLTPLAVIEGPIVTVIAAYLARLNYFSLLAVIGVVITADLIGDICFYLAGRGMVKKGGVPPKWMQRLGLSPARLDGLIRKFDVEGGKLIVIGKLTHSAGMAVLLGAGIARMRFIPFIFYSTISTIPKSLLFVAIGYGFGNFVSQVDHWFAVVSLILLVIIVLVSMYWLKRTS
ncbi:DedA family protein [Acinetobacter sp. MB5]|uniref:DedA family protein n=1 Tax=Acinetobacter sp. MB5 TaxID=2069438 RepID=UPI000DD0A5E8|nr:VTT domain-containing protein [Acinetobacter sp. MB5]